MVTAKFPSPLEVDRFISQLFLAYHLLDFLFPSPLEVDRFISVRNKFLLKKVIRFPSPLEVDRFISVDRNTQEVMSYGFRPLSR